MRADRQSAYEQFSMDLDAAIQNELRLGAAVIDSEAIPGAQRFAGGKGRHGSFDDV